MYFSCLLYAPPFSFYNIYQSQHGREKFTNYEILPYVTFPNSLIMLCFLGQLFPSISIFKFRQIWILVIYLAHQLMHTHKIVYIGTFKIAPTCFDPKIIFREVHCSLLKSHFLKQSLN